MRRNQWLRPRGRNRSVAVVAGLERARRCQSSHTGFVASSCGAWASPQAVTLPTLRTFPNLRPVLRLAEGWSAVQLRRLDRLAADEVAEIGVRVLGCCLEQIALIGVTRTLTGARLDMATPHKLLYDNSIQAVCSGSLTTRPWSIRSRDRTRSSDDTIALTAYPVWPARAAPQARHRRRGRRCRATAPRAERVVRDVVALSRPAADLVKDVACIDAGVDQMNRRAEISGVAGRQRPVAAVHAAIFRRDAGMVIENRAGDRGQCLLRQQPAAGEQDNLWPRSSRSTSGNSGELAEAYLDDRLARRGSVSSPFSAAIRCRSARRRTAFPAVTSTIVPSWPATVIQPSLRARRMSSAVFGFRCLRESP